MLGLVLGLGPRLILCMHFSHSTDDGCFLGINPNFKIYVKGLSLRKVREAEQTAEDDADLARKLFLLIFKQELAEKPHGVCCTEADGKELLNQTYLTAIRSKSSCSLAGSICILICLSHSCRSHSPLLSPSIRGALYLTGN